MPDGIIVINKNKGCTSHDIVSKVKKIFKEKTGHTGTLDPNATGVLPILIGKGTKLSYYLVNHDKEYEVTLQLGIKTDTADEEGNIIQELEVQKELLESKNVYNILQSFIGKQMQIPPMYSAIKVNGKKLYEYARNNQNIEIKPRQIEIYEIGLLKIDKLNNQIEFKVKCSKGTYIRSLCEDIAKSFNTVGYMKELKRTMVGRFCIEDSVTVEQLEKNKENDEFMKKYFFSIEEFFKNDNLDAQIKLNAKKLNMFLNGVCLQYTLEDGLYRIYDQYNFFIGIGLVKNNLLKREIVVENNKII